MILPFLHRLDLGLLLGVSIGFSVLCIVCFKINYKIALAITILSLFMATAGVQLLLDGPHIYAIRHEMGVVYLISRSSAFFLPLSVCVVQHIKKYTKAKSI